MFRPESAVLQRADKKDGPMPSIAACGEQAHLASEMERAALTLPRSGERRVTERYGIAHKDTIKPLQWSSTTDACAHGMCMLIRSR